MSRRKNGPGPNKVHYHLCIEALAVAGRAELDVARPCKRAWMMYPLLIVGISLKRGNPRVFIAVLHFREILYSDCVVVGRGNGQSDQTSWNADCCILGDISQANVEGRQ